MNNGKKENSDQFSQLIDIVYLQIPLLLIDIVDLEILLKLPSKRTEETLR